ncbi:MAG: head-tail connector protein [Beijerinckiaceae bacterium]
MRRILVNPPAVEPLTLAEAKRWLRVDHVEDDGLILSLIRMARERVEGRTGRALMAQGWKIILDRWPADGCLRLPVFPALSVTAVRVIDAAGVASVLAAARYRLEPGEEPPLLAVDQPPPPGLARGGIEIDLVAGYGTEPSHCPEPLRQAVRLILADAYERRGPERADKARPVDVAEAERLISPYRALHLSRSGLEIAA